jgi:hypothetical protein
MKRKWIPWPSAPKLYVDLVVGRKKIGTIARVQTPAEKRKGKFGSKWMAVTKFAVVGGMPGTYGVVFPTMKAAKAHIEGRL